MISECIRRKSLQIYHNSMINLNSDIIVIKIYVASIFYHILSEKSSDFTE